MIYNKISIIVPVYNVDKYLTECINSVVNQSYDNWELILVDDGSTDSSGSICDMFAQKDSRVKTYHQINSGVASARNFGLKNANGYYITYLDSDDYIMPNYLETMISIIERENADIVIGKYYKNIDIDDEINLGGGGISVNTILDLTESLKMCLSIGSESYRTYLWGRVYKSDLKNNLFIPEIYTMGEDMIAFVQAVVAANRVAFTNYSGYFYRQRMDAATKTFKESYLSSIDAGDFVYGILDGYSELQELVNFKTSVRSYELLIRAAKSGYKKVEDIKKLQRYARRQLKSNYCHLSIKNRLRLLLYTSGRIGYNILKISRK